MKEEEKNEEGQKERELKRTLGLIILRGDTIITLSAEQPPT